MSDRLKGKVASILFAREGAKVVPSVAGLTLTTRGGSLGAGR